MSYRAPAALPLTTPVALSYRTSGRHGGSSTLGERIKFVATLSSTDDPSAESLRKRGYLTYANNASGPLDPSYSTTSPGKRTAPAAPEKAVQGRSRASTKVPSVPKKRKRLPGPPEGFPAPQEGGEWSAVRWAKEGLDVELITGRAAAGGGKGKDDIMVDAEGTESDEEEEESDARTSSPAPDAFATPFIDDGAGRNIGRQPLAERTTLSPPPGLHAEHSIHSSTSQHIYSDDFGSAPSAFSPSPAPAAAQSSFPFRPPPIHPSRLPLQRYLHVSSPTSTPSHTAPISDLSVPWIADGAASQQLPSRPDVFPPSRGPAAFATSAGATSRGSASSAAGAPRRSRWGPKVEGWEEGSRVGASRAPRSDLGQEEEEGARNSAGSSTAQESARYTAYPPKQARSAEPSLSIPLGSTSARPPSSTSFLPHSPSPIPVSPSLQTARPPFLAQSFPAPSASSFDDTPRDSSSGQQGLTRQETLPGLAPGEMYGNRARPLPVQALYTPQPPANGAYSTSSASSSSSSQKQPVDHDHLRHLLWNATMEDVSNYQLSTSFPWRFRCGKPRCRTILHSHDEYQDHMEGHRNEKQHFRCAFPGCGKMSRHDKEAWNHAGYHRASLGKDVPHPFLGDFPDCGQILRSSPEFHRHLVLAHAYWIISARTLPQDLAWDINGEIYRPWC